MTGRGALISWFPSREGEGGATGAAAFLVGSVVVVGRDADCDIVLQHEQVSRRHARLEIMHSVVLLTDLNTTNGSRIDGRRRLGSVPWRSGEILQIAGYVLELADVSAAVANPLVESAGAAQAEHPTDDAVLSSAEAHP